MIRKLQIKVLKKIHKTDTFGLYQLGYLRIGQVELQDMPESLRKNAIKNTLKENLKNMNI